MENINWRPILIVGGVALLAYFLFFRGGSSGTSGASSSGGSSDQTSTGDISLQPGTETIEVSTPNSSTSTTTPVTSPITSGNPQPGPPVKKPTAPVHQTKTLTYRVRKGDTLASIAKRYHISVGELAHANVYVKGEVPGNKKVGERLGTGAGLKTGQVLKIPGQ